MILYRLFVYAWIVIVKKLFASRLKDAVQSSNDPDITRRKLDDNSYYSTQADFHKHVEAALNGDDNTFTVSDEVVAWFNPRSIAEVWSGIGVTTKTPCEAPRALKDVEFLSHKFVYINGLWLPSPDTARVLNSLQWASSDDDVRWHLLRACALRIDSWANVQVRKVLRDYIDHLWHNYATDMIGDINGLSMTEINAVYKSDLWCWSLYSGQEGKMGKSIEAFTTHINRDVYQNVHLQCHTEALIVLAQNCAVAA